MTQRRRIAVTVPPAGWFHGIARSMFEIYRAGLVELGFDLFDVPVEAFLGHDDAAAGAVAEELKAFRPELAFGLPKGSYALLGRLPANGGGTRPNLFTDMLEIPTICLWDHAPLELANVLLRDHSTAVAPAEEPADEMLRRVLTHPLLIHWSPDSGQTRLMEELGFLLPGQVIQEPLPSLPEFHKVGNEAIGGRGRRSVGFVGHFYQETPKYANPELSAMAGAVIEAWLPAYERSPWRVLLERLAAMDGSTRERLALTPRHAECWQFAHQLVIHQAQTALRLKVLGAVGTAVVCHGNLDLSAPGVPDNLVAAPGHIPFGPELARALRRYEVGIDVFNPGSVDGYSHKPLLAFAAGGFLLMNRKRDFINSFGEAGEAVSYGNDLAAKVDRYLTSEKLRNEVGGEIRRVIRERFQLRDVLVRVVAGAWRRAGEIQGRSDG